METTAPRSPTVAAPEPEEALPSVPALVTFLATRAHYRRTLLSTNEVFCGPDCRDRLEEGRVLDLQTPVGSYDLRALVARLPEAQHPALILVKADGTGRNQPRHLDAFHCPKILLVGDTHHMQAPIRKLLRYASEERFDLIVFDHTRQHAHYFIEAGFENVYWIPAFDLSPHEQPWRERVDPQVAFVGQVGRFHPYRLHVLDSLERAGVVVQRMTASPDQAAATYARSLINLNCSLNGDLNLRVFEVLSSGGFLLTDRLAPQAGLDRLFRDGEHLVCYDGVEDLRAKIEHYLAHPAEARRIARAGRDEYLAQHRPAQKIAAMMSLLGGGQPSALHRVAGRGRAVQVPGVDLAAVAARAAGYELLQELHRTAIEPVALFTEGVDPRLVADAADLPRLRLLIERGPGAPGLFAFLTERGIAEGRVAMPGEGELEDGLLELDVVVTTAGWVLEGRGDRVTDHADAVMLEAAPTPDTLARVEARLRARGFQRVEGLVPPTYHLTDEVTIGERHFAAGQPEEAARHFQAALAQDPENVRALNNLGVVTHLFGEPAAAAQFVEAALALDRRDPETLMNLAELRLQAGRGDEARALFELVDGRDLPLPALVERAASLRAALPPVRPRPVRGPSTPPRRILLVTNLFPPQELGGYGRLMQDFALLLRQRGHTVEVLTSDTVYLGPSPSEPYVSRPLRLFGGWRDGATVLASDAEIEASSRFNAEKVEQAIARLQPDVCLFGNLDLIGRPCLGVALERGVPVLHHLGNRLPGYALGETPQDPGYRLACASQWLAEHVRSQGFPLRDVVVVYPGAHVDSFQMPVAPSRRRLRIAYASLVMPYKGAHVLVDALFRLAGRGIEFTCTIAGTTTQPEYVEALRKAVKAAGLDQVITFAGNLGRQALQALFGRSNVLVFPTQGNEPFGISQVEAMAAGLTVVTTGTGGSAEVVEDGVSGLVFPKGDFEALADRLASLPADRERWARLAENGRRRALDQFDIQRSVDALERHFGALIERRSIPEVPASSPSPQEAPVEDEVTIGEGHFAAGRIAEAARHFQAALAANPENVRALNDLGVLTHQCGDPVAAAQFVESALSLDRRDPETLLNLIELRREAGRGDEAVRLLRSFDGRSALTPALAERVSALRAELPAPASSPARSGSAPARRILLVTNLFPPQELGGYGRLMFEFARLLRARGHTIEVLTSDTPYLGPSPAEPGISRTLRLFGGWRDGGTFTGPAEEIQPIGRANADEVLRAIARFQPDVCLFGNIDFLAPHCLFRTIEAGVPVLHHLGNRRPGYVQNESPQQPNYRVACASGWLAGNLRSEGYFLPDVVVVYPGAKVEDFRMPIAAPLGRLRIAYASLLMPYKGAHVLVTALAKLAERGVAFTCTIAGGSTYPDYVQALRRAIAAAGLERVVTFPGNLGREELAQLFGRSNVLVFPTEFQEPFGISQVEAMAAGLTVITTGTGGSAEIVEDGVSGLVFPNGDAAALADRLSGLAADRARWARLGENGRRRAFGSFDIEHSIDDLERHFSELIARGKGGAVAATAPAPIAPALVPPSEPPSDAEADRLRQQIVRLVAQHRYADFADVVRAGARLNELRPALDRDALFQWSMAFASWVAREHDRSVVAGKKAVALEPGNARNYLTLSWAYLTAGKFAEARAVLVEGTGALPDPAPLAGWRKLAEVAASGKRQAELIVDGESYVFELFFFSGQTMEAAVHHVQGAFTELAELRFLRDEVKTSEVIVEVGTLVGNHTVFFSRALRPRRIYAFDADVRSIDATTRNFRANLAPGSRTELVTVDRAVGDGRRMIDLGGRPVRMTTLDAEVLEPVDFLKIDVDGMELKVLEGARALLQTYRPRALIEVSNDNAPAFLRFLESVGYRVVRTFKRSDDTNYYVTPTTEPA